MSWLISLVVASLMFASNGKSPVTANHNFTESKPNIEKTNIVDETERFSQIYPLSANGRVSVSNVNGSITLDTWDRNEVKLEYVKTADDRSQLATFEVKIDSRTDRFSAETDYDQSQRTTRDTMRNHGKTEVQYTLTVPRNAVLDEIETVNGSVTITNATNRTKASSVNGQVRATNLRGAANLSTVNGTVEADFDQLQAGSRISLDTVNGQASLVIPSDANATVKADTVNGNISNDFGLPVRKGQYVGKDLYGRIGSGDVQIRLNSVNGILSLKRKNDGKSVNPATDLLTTRSEDDSDNDEDMDNDSGVRAPKAPKPPKAPRTVIRNGAIDAETRKSIEEGMKQAQKQMEKMGPELQKLNVEKLKQVADINSPEIQAQIKAGQAQSREIMARLADINWTIGSPVIEEKSDSLTVKGTPKVTVDAGNCAVSVRGWDKSEVRYSATRFSKIRNQAPLNLQVTQNGSDVNIKLAEDENNKSNDSKNENSNDLNKYFFNDASQIRIEIFVPKKSNLKIVTGGEIRLENVSGDVDLQGADESVNVRDADGKLSVGTTDGKIRVIGFKGEVDTRTSSGAINLEGDFHGLTARTVDGIITLVLPENANANIESNRKDIVGDGVPLIFQGGGKTTSTWKVGSGGENCSLYATADGRVIVRSVKQLQN